MIKREQGYVTQIYGGTTGVLYFSFNELLLVMFGVVSSIII